MSSRRSSKAYAAFREAAGVYAQSRSDQKYTYKLRDFEIKAKVKSGWSNNTQRTELVLLIEIGCKMERMENSTGKIVDVSNLSMTMERRFGADASISADGILEGDARVVLTTHSTLTVDFVLKKGLMDSDDAQEEYFRNLYKNACDKKDLLPIDTIPTGQETLIPAFYVPIPLPMGFALDVNVYLVLDWEACGEFGVTYQHVNTMSFGFALNDWDFSGVGYSSNRYSMNAYLAGKIRASAGIRPEFGLSWMKVLRVGANTTVSAYAEVGGMVGFTVSSTQKIRPLWGGYVGCGVELDARVFGEVGVWPFNYKLDYVLMSKDIEFFGLGTKEMPLGFEQDGEEYVLSMDYEQPVQLKDRVNMMARVQDLGTMEIDRKAAKDCRFTLIAPQKYVQLNPDGSLTIRGCDITDFDLEIRITSGVVYKDITVHVTVDHRHEYQTAYFAGDCTHDEYNVHRCTRCSYVYEEILTVAPGHDYSQFIVDKEPTCTADGKRHGTCVRCGYTGTEAIPKLGHDYSVQLPEDAHLYRPATCQGAAWYYYVCANCGGHSSRYTYEYGPLGDHSYADPFTCHDRPCTTRNCSHISEASTEHPWTAWIPVEPGGCAVEPYSIRACRDCGLTENALGSDHVQAHEPELLPGLEPTCYEPGYQDYVICSVCGAELNKTELAPLEHNIRYRAITETTHVEYCHRRGCDYESGPIGHIHTGWTQTQAPTCETDGREEAVCACGHRKSRIIKAPGHTKVTDPAVAPTCTEEGLTEGAHCGVCGRILAAQQPVAATGHTFDQKKTTDTYKAAEATCTEPETYYYSCICGAKGTETFRGGDVRPHTFDQQKATDEYRAGEATCTEPETYYYSCICGAKGSETFRSGLTELMIPGGVTSIGYGAFYGCSGLTELEIPGGITSIGGQAFKNCHALKTIYYEGTQARWDAVVKGEGWNDNCPVQVICLGGAAASEGLEFTLSDNGTYYTVTGIGSCTDTELVIPGTHQGLPVREIGDYAFYGCSGLESITIPEGVTAIGIAAFSRCSDLAQVTLPKGLTTIGDGAFGFCTSLRTITIPQGVTTIGNWVFENCSGLEKIELPKGVTTIGDFAFQYCSGLTVVTMPARVTRIGVWAFLDCTALETIYFEGTQAQWDAVEKRSGWNDGCPAQVICLGGAAASQGMGSPGSKDRGPRVGACSMDCAP